jgi:hypothetical protein
MGQEQELSMMDAFAAAAAAAVDVVDAYSVVITG